MNYKYISLISGTLGSFLSLSANGQKKHPTQYSISFFVTIWDMEIWAATVNHLSVPLI